MKRSTSSARQSPEQLEIQAVHRIRQRVVANRTRLVNQVRGLLGEHGVVVPRDINRIRRTLGPMISTAMVAAVGEGEAFDRGRDFAAWVGLVPRQYSTGGRTILGRITKRGSRYLRMLFVQAAKVILMRPTGGRTSASVHGSHAHQSGCIATGWQSRWRTNWPGWRGVY